MTNPQIAVSSDIRLNIWFENVSGADVHHVSVIARSNDGSHSTKVKFENISMAEMGFNLNCDPD